MDFGVKIKLWREQVDDANQLKRHKLPMIPHDTVAEQGCRVDLIDRVGKVCQPKVHLDHQIFFHH